MAANKETIAAELKAYIKERSRTQKDVAERAGISTPHLSNLLNGQEAISYSAARKICDIFPELNIDYLMKGEGSLTGRTSVQHLNHVRNTGNIVNGGSVIQGDAALAAENAQLREQLAQANAEKDRLLGIIETLTNRP